MNIILITVAVGIYLFTRNKNHSVFNKSSKTISPYKAFLNFVLFKKEYKSNVNKRSFLKGEAFERYTRDKIFTKSQYALVQKTHNYDQNRNDFVESSLNPDFKFRDLRTKKVFWIECKFRSYNATQLFDVISSKQLKRHKSKIEPVFVLVGIGENPSSPKYLFKIPIEKCSPKMKLGVMFNYQLNLKE